MAEPIAVSAAELQAFAARLAEAGLHPQPERLPGMLAGFRRLQAMIERNRCPRALDAEPAFLFRAGP